VRSDGEEANDGKDLRQQAGEIMAYMKANNYEVVEAGEAVTFRGVVKKSISQACFLIFCTVLAMASLALVLQIRLQDFSEYFNNKITLRTPNCLFIFRCDPYIHLSTPFISTSLQRYRSSESNPTSITS